MKFVRFIEYAGLGIPVDMYVVQGALETEMLGSFSSGGWSLLALQTLFKNVMYF